MSNMVKCRFEQALALTGDVPSPIIDQISELWSAAFEMVVVLESVGVVIINFQPADEKDRDSELDEMMSLAAKIAKVPKDAGKCIHLINVTLKADKTARIPVARTQRGIPFECFIQ